MAHGKLRRLLLVLGPVLLAGGLTRAEIVTGRNVNMVAGTEWPQGDPFLQRQNEPSVAVSSRNPLHLLAGANDYRSVDIPFPPQASRDDSKEVGDAWVGVFHSRNGGQTWTSTLLPGYPQDVSPAGLLSPLKGYGAAADPVVRAGTNGLFYYSGIVFDREPNGKGAVFVARFIDNNSVENRRAADHDGTTIVDSGGAGQFLDKSWLAVDVPRAGAGTCTVQGQTFAAGNVYVAYAIFLGNDNSIRTKLMFARSSDCGKSWSKTKLSEGFPVNQGAAIAIEPSTGHVYVAWRQFATSNTTDAILFAKSVDGGQTFTKTAQVWSFDAFQQGTTPITMRINSFPTLAVVGGRVYLAYSERGHGPGGDSRIVMTSSGDGGNAWTAPAVAVPDAARGHQFMPALTVVRGRLVLGYYTLLEDHTRGVYTSLGGGQYLETREPMGDLAPPDPSPEKVFTRFLMDAAPANFVEPLKRRHTVDVHVAEAEPAAAPVFSDTRASRYTFGSRPQSTLIEQLGFNPPNLPLFSQGTVPFLGDYIDLAGATFRLLNGVWGVDAGPGPPISHVVWTDNRDVRPPQDGDWTHYTPVTSAAVGEPSKVDPSQSVPPCASGQAGMRNQNIYTARIDGGLVVGSPGNNKPLGAIQRTFVVFVHNTTGQKRSYRLAASQPPAGQASFRQFAALPTVDASVGPRSSVSRSVFVTSSDPDASVTVAVTEIDAPGGAPVPGGLADQVALNADPSTPDLTNPDVWNPDVENPDVANAEVYNPDVENPDVANPDVENPDVTNPDVENPDVENYDAENPDVANPDVANPDVVNPDVANPDVANPDVANPDVQNGSITDTTWTVTNNGNTTASYSASLLLDGTVPPGFKTQVILYRTYKTPVAQGCDLKIRRHHHVVANVPDPTFYASLEDLLAADPLDPSVKNATLSLAPGEQGEFALRVVDPNRADAVTFDASTSVTAVVRAHAANTGETTPRFSLSRSLLRFQVQPGSADAGLVLSSTPQVLVVGRRGQLAGNQVTLAIGNNPNSALLSGTTTQTTNAQGLAVFPGLSLDAHGTGYTLVASGPGGTATSAPFNIVGYYVDLERFPDGTAACASCALTNQFAIRGGLTFSFTSAVTELTNAQLFLSSAYDPPAEPPNHSATSAASDGGGFFLGTVRFEVANFPTVSFRLRGNNEQAVYPVAAFDAAGNAIPAGQITRSDVSTYTSPGGFTFRQETVAINNSGGVARVDLDMTGGFIFQLDNVRLMPDTGPIVR